MRWQESAAQQQQAPTAPPSWMCGTYRSRALLERLPASWAGGQCVPLFGCSLHLHSSVFGLLRKGVPICPRQVFHRNPRPVSSIARLHERQASRISVSVHDTPAATHAAVSASNLQLGHGLLLRAAALAQALAEEQEQAAAAAAAAEDAAATRAENGGVSRSASAAALLTPEPSMEGAVVEIASSRQTPPAGGEESPQPAAVAQQVQESAVDGQPQQAAAAAGEAVQPPAVDQLEQQHGQQQGQPGGPPDPSGQSATAAGKLAGLYAASTGSRASMAAEEEQLGQQPASLPSQPQAEQPTEQHLQHAALQPPPASSSAVSSDARAVAASPGSPPPQAAAAAAPAGADAAEAEQAALPAAPAPAPSKPVYTSIQLSDIRLVLRYQPVLHPAGGAGGGSQHGAGGSGIPAAVHDFLSVHQDLLALDVPLLRLQLPLDPAGLVEAAAAAARNNGRGAGAAATEGRSPPTSMLPSAAASGGSSPLAASSPRTGGSRSRGGSWRELSLAPLACSPGLAAEASSPSPVRQQPSQLQAPSEQQVLVEAGRLTLSAAAVGYARHAMLPVLQLPSLRLACSMSGSSSSGGGVQPVRHSRSASAASAPMWPGGSSAPAAAAAVAYQLEVSALDIGLHPSQLSMLAAAAQICEHELALLGREPQEGPGTDSESAVTSLSGTLERQQSTARTLMPAVQPQQPPPLQQQGASPSPQPPAGAPAAGRRESQESAASGPAAAAGEAGGASPQHAQQEAAAAEPAAADVEGGAEDGSAPAPPQLAMPQWRLEAAIGCIGLSILGSTASSTCLKVEWHGLRASCAACGSAGSAAAAVPGQAGSVPAHRQRSSSWDGSLQPEAWEGAHEVQLSWRQLAVHVLEPRPAYQHPSLSPFAFAAAIVADAQRSRWAQAAAVRVDEQCVSHIPCL